MATRNDSDKELLRASKEGDQLSKERLIRRYMPLVNWHARHAAENNSQFDDYTQEALIGLMRAVDTYNEASGVQFNTYATTCITNALISLKRKLARVPVSYQQSGDEENSLENIEDAKSEESAYEPLYLEELRKRLTLELSERELNVLILHAEGYSYKEIAGRLSATPKQVANALARARSKLKKL